MKTSPVAWLCMNKKSGSLFALTQEQLNELGYGNISMPEFEKVAPLYCYEPAKKLWLWKNFVDGKPEYWAFDNPYPTNLDGGDPQTLGQPCGYAIFKPSRDGSCGRTEEQVLREMESVTAPPQRNWVGLTDEELERMANRSNWWLPFARAIEAKLKEKNGNF